MPTDQSHGAKHFIHLGVPRASADEVRRDAREVGISLIDLDLDGVTSNMGLCQRLSEVFMYPHKTSGLDAAIDLISDLGWFGSEHGYLVLIHDLEEVSAEVAGDLGGIWPYIVDRWRSQQTTFVVLALDARSQPALADQVRQANFRLDLHGSLPWARPDIGSVDVEDGPWDRNLLV